MNYKKLLNNSLWSIFGQLSFMIILFVTNILLAKTLSLNEFGQISIVLFFINVSNVLVESGLGGALIRKSTIESKDYSTVFVFNLSISVALYLILWFSTGFISKFYNDDALEVILKFQGIAIILNAFQIVPNIKLIVDIKFKLINKIKFFSITLSSIIGLVLAYYYNFGVWSMVIMQVSNIFFNTILLNIVTKNNISFLFDCESFKSIYKFGINTTIASIINTIYDNIYNLILSKFFAMSVSGNFYQAKKLSEVPNSIMNTLNQGLIFSFLSKNQNDKQLYLKNYNLFFVCILWASTFIFLFIFLFADLIIVKILGEKWIDSIFFLKCLSVFSYFYILEQYNRVSFKVFDKTNVILWLEVLKKILQTISIGFGIYFKSYEKLMYGLVVTSFLSYGINCIYSKKYLNLYSKLEIINFTISLFLFSTIISVKEIFKLDLINSILTILIATICTSIVLYINYFKHLKNKV
ncbi:lipopolysaccharide biosynthesis protein [Sphingobacteriaceae bacterium WQ 2009]|uniref:Lipopolysaccharide biosynthesis protein n=1 Tax=Rhinopithecimicrobium faecis TaxID=2820698 RepID=A0A8T4HA09_9SPHI|nr:lipopolysaccharide biosynthesis protein [Sphingobacteriaceae bacterium WQ 2009]